MATATMERGTDSQTATIPVNQVKAIRLATGWQNVEGCELVQFAISQSPVPRFYPTLSYRDGDTGEKVYVPLKHVLSFSSTRMTSGR